MKYLKQFENKNWSEEDILEIKSILRDVKDEYPYIDGQIFLNDTIEIVLDCENTLSQDLERGSLEHSKSKLKFINTLVDTIERLESSLNTKTWSQNLWNWDHWQDTKIKIHII